MDMESFIESVVDLLKSISSFVEKCSDKGLLDFMGLILSMVIPIYIMNRTIKHEKKEAKQDAIEREQQYQENLKIAEQHHIERLKSQEEINRVSIMPYITIENISVKTENDRVVFSILFKNIGNGTAINLTTKYLEKIPFFHKVCKTELANYYCEDPSDVPVLRIDEEYEITISQKLKEEVLINLDTFYVTIEYTDMKQHPYEQTYGVYFDAQDLKKIETKIEFISSPESKQII